FLIFLTILSPEVFWNLSIYSQYRTPSLRRSTVQPLSHLLCTDPTPKLFDIRSRPKGIAIRGPVEANDYLE
ncbi:hypothetical protein LINGRAHAP2_LOCUS7589, partial [Linum grandiflorum]